MVSTRSVNIIKAAVAYRSRLVVQWWCQVPGIDCGGTFALIFRLQSVGVMLAIAVEPAYEVVMLNLQAVLLNSDVEDSGSLPPATTSTTNPDYLWL